MLSPRIRVFGGEMRNVEASAWQHARVSFRYRKEIMLQVPFQSTIANITRNSWLTKLTTFRSYSDHFPLLLGPTPGFPIGVLR